MAGLMAHRSLAPSIFPELVQTSLLQWWYGIALSADSRRPAGFL